MFDKTCRCKEYGYYEGMPYSELRKFVAEEKYCTSRKYKLDPFSASWQCPTIARALRAFDTTNAYTERRRKQLKRDGYSEDQIEQKIKSGKKRQRGGGTIQAAVVEFNFDDILVDQPKKRGRIRADA